MFEFMGHLVNGKTLGLADLGESETYPNPYAIYVAGFLPCSVEVVDSAENMLGFRFPDVLRQYYLSVGVGQLVPANREAAISDNNVLIPTHIPKLIGNSCGWMMPYTKIQPGTIPFFERGVDLFLCLHPNSDNPSAVHWMWGDKICDSLVEFFQRFIEDPDWFNLPVERKAMS